MGIEGLTKFVNIRSDLYLENYELYGTQLVIDGHSISCQLYNWKHWIFDAKSYNCYGGDYDKYARIVTKFFELLLSVKVRPIVVFDGGFEYRKLPTILKRMQDKIDIADILTPQVEERQPYKVIFPLFLREVFKDVLLKLGVKMVMCEYEADTETASIAKALDCPVLTFDSDYYLFGVKYIPFSTVDYNVESHKYIPCRMFNVEKVLSDFPGLQLNTFQLLPMLLGNDYIDSFILKEFLQSINAHTNMSKQDRIKYILNWLRLQTPHSAISKFLASFKNKQEKLSILQKIEKIVSSYYMVDSPVLEFLQIENCDYLQSNNKIDFSKLSDEITKKTGDCAEKADEIAINQEETSCSNSKNSHLEKENVSENPISDVFKENFRKCLYPSSFMDIITQNKYYCIPQAENHMQTCSHKISFEIINAIHKILTHSQTSKLVIIGRSNGTKVEWHPQNMFSKNVPSVEEIEHMSLKDRQILLLHILDIDKSFMSVVNKFPNEWHIFLVCLKFYGVRSGFEMQFIYSLILSFISLNYIDNIIGYCRSVSKCRQLYSYYCKQRTHGEPRSVKEAEFLPRLSPRDCVMFMQKVVDCFQMSIAENMDKNLVHQMAQMQSILLHVKYLNTLLRYPYSNLLIHKIINSTFIYNMTTSLKKKKANIDYFKGYFSNCPSVLASLEFVVKLLTTNQILV